MNGNLQFLFDYCATAKYDMRMWKIPSAIGTEFYNKEGGGDWAEKKRKKEWYDRVEICVIRSLFEQCNTSQTWV